MVWRFSDAILTGAYAHQAEGGEAGDGGDVLQDVLPTVITGRETRRPYFEVLFVTPQPASRWPAMCAEIRRLRRIEDDFIYEPVIVGSFEDALCAAIVNPQILAVIVAEGFAVPLRCMTRRCCARILDKTLGKLRRQRIRAEARRRPEEDPAGARSLCHDRPRRGDARAASSSRPASAGSSTRWKSCWRLHLAILEGIQARYETPFFDNLKNYAQRPIGTFHALPIARGKSVFRSDWIRDMGEFYGINLFLAESSATTGGLDSLLEPTGNIKKAQDMAARAFGADHVFFVTNGTSTSNKMVVQALVAPGDIVIVDRNCHKSHHYGLVLAAASRSMSRPSR